MSSHLAVFPVNESKGLSVIRKLTIEHTLIHCTRSDKKYLGQIFFLNTTNIIEMTAMWDTWQHLTPHTRGADGSLTQSCVS
jgi:hypothetical protein